MYADDWQKSSTVYKQIVHKVHEINTFCNLKITKKCLVFIKSPNTGRAYKTNCGPIAAQSQRFRNHRTEKYQLKPSLKWNNSK